MYKMYKKSLSIQGTHHKQQTTRDQPFNLQDLT